MQPDSDSTQTKIQHDGSRYNNININIQAMQLQYMGVAMIFKPIIT